MDRIQIKQEAKEVLKGNRLMLLLILLLVGVITSVLAATIVGFILTPLLGAAVYFLIKYLIHHKQVVAERLYNQFTSFNHALKIVLVGLLVQVIIALGFCLFIIPGIIFAFQYSQALFIITENKDLEVMEALRRSKDMMYGHKFELFVFHLSFFGHFLLIFLTFGLYALYFMPYYSTCITNYYLHLSGQTKEQAPEFIDVQN